MKTFFDTSAFAKRYIYETGSEEVEKLCQNSNEIAISVICIPELISALNRRIRDKTLTIANYSKVKTSLYEETKHLQVINLIPEVIETTIKILETNSLRAMDSIHIACSMLWNTDMFITSDLRQLEAAKNLGLNSVLV